MPLPRTDDRAPDGEGVATAERSANGYGGGASATAVAPRNGASGDTAVALPSPADAVQEAARTGRGLGVDRRLALAQVAVSLVALGAVVYWALGQPAPRIPGTLDALAWLGGAIAIYAVVTAARAERWHRILRHCRIRVSRADSYGLTTVGYMANNTLPARAGDLLRVILLSRRVDAGKRTLLGTVIAERLLDALALGLVLLVVAYGILDETALPGEQPALLAGGALLLVVLAGAGLLVARRRGYLSRARAFIRPIADAPRSLLGRTGAALLLVSLVIWSLEAAVFMAVAQAVDLDLGVMEALYVVALTNLTAAIPAAPGYVGTFDAAVIFGVRTVGGTGRAALSFLLLLRFALFVPITVVGLVVLVTRYGGWSPLRALRRARPARR